MSDSMGTDTRSHHDHHGRGGPWTWMGGAVLIVLGLGFLAQNLGYSIGETWWAVFVYLAAAANFVSMWRSYRADGHFGQKATGSLTAGLLLTVIATILFTGGGFDKWWPAILIAIGSGIVIGGILGGRARG